MLPVGVDWMMGLLSDAYLAQYERQTAAGGVGADANAATDVAVVAATLAVVARAEALLPDVLSAADDGAPSFHSARLVFVCARMY